MESPEPSVLRDEPPNKRLKLKIEDQEDEPSTKDSSVELFCGPDIQPLTESDGETEPLPVLPNGNSRSSEENLQEHSNVKRAEDVEIIEPVNSDENKRSKTSKGKRKRKSKPKSSNLRKNIKEILQNDQLDEETLAARKEEAERRERMVQKQMLLHQQQQQQHQYMVKLCQDQLKLVSESMKNASNNNRSTYHPPVYTIDDEDEDDNGDSSDDIMSRARLTPPKEQEVFDISSDEDSSDKELSHINAGVTNGHMFRPVSVNNNIGHCGGSVSQYNLKAPKEEDAQSDDDCVIISPTPPETEKEEADLDALNTPDELGRVLVNVGHSEKEPDLFLPPHIAKIVKPHQIGGIRFLYDNVVDSIERFESSNGFGCILAQSMGLGKTIQAVTFCDVFLRTSNKANRVLIIVPINTIQNWLNEFNHWLPPKKGQIFNSFKVEPEEDQNKETGEEKFIQTEESYERNFNVYVLNETVKNLKGRRSVVEQWGRSRGVLLVGYEMFRMLALKKLKRSGRKPKVMNKSRNEELQDMLTEEEHLSQIYQYLVDPGPDLIICDEGHRIKNSGASISQALKEVRTRRRIVLTGYPLQNNLMEYWCMVDFIRPNYLGTKSEFSNMFERPIQNGQCCDSTYEDKKLMKYRAHVLHSLLEGFVQRRSHAVLRKALPRKQEWVFLLKMSNIQCNLYKEFIRYLQTCRGSNESGNVNPIKAFAVCCKIWNHPDALYNVVKKKKSLLEDLDIDDYINGKQRGTKGPRSKKTPPINLDSVQSFQSLQDNSSNSLFEYQDPFRLTEFSGTSPISSTGSGRESSAINLDWAVPILEKYQPGLLENGVKFQLLMEILKETVAVKDKILVFSQSLYTLDLIEFFLEQKFQWQKGSEYYRLDGSTTGLEREKLIKHFNGNEKVILFLVSTRAGSLGINLTSANRVVVFDASWNPCHDCQAVCRVYRYGQTKECQIYRFVTDFSLEKRIYDRQINKRGMSDRVVDESNPNLNLKSKDVNQFLVLDVENLEKLPYLKCDVDTDNFDDVVMKNVLSSMGDIITDVPFEHESLLIDQKHQKLSAAEKRMALKNYEQEKKVCASNGGVHSYSRPSYAAFYPKPTSSRAAMGNDMFTTHDHRRMNQYANPSVKDIRPFSSEFNPTHQTSRSSSTSGAAGVNLDAGIEMLMRQGIKVQHVFLSKDGFLRDPAGGPNMFLNAGDKIYILRSRKGTYLKLPNGRFIAIRRNHKTACLPCMQIPYTEDLSRSQLNDIIGSFVRFCSSKPQQQLSTNPIGSSLNEFKNPGRDLSQLRDMPLAPQMYNLPLEQPLPPSSVKPPLPSFSALSSDSFDYTSLIDGWKDQSNNRNNFISNPVPMSSEYSHPNSLNQLSNFMNSFHFKHFPIQKLQEELSKGNSAQASPHHNNLGMGEKCERNEVEIIPISSKNENRNYDDSRRMAATNSSFLWDTPKPAVTNNQTGVDDTEFYKDFTITVRNQEKANNNQYMSGLKKRIDINSDPHQINEGSSYFKGSDSGSSRSSSNSEFSYSEKGFDPFVMSPQSNTLHPVRLEEPQQLPSFQGI